MIGQALEQAENRLKKAGIRTARLDVLVLFEKVSGIKREWLLAHSNRAVSTDTYSKYKQLIKKRAQRIPLPQLTGKQEFWGLEFRVNKHTLIPRPESEKIVEYALEHRSQKAAVLDVGTGCGCIAVAVAKERPSWKISATDVSAEALKVAKANAKKHGVEIAFSQSDVLDNVKGQFDVITANLPYLKAGQKKNLTPEATKEPEVALFGGADGLDIYRKFFSQITDVSEPNSLVIIESDPWQQPELIKLAETARLKLKHQDRFVLAFKN